MEQRVNIILTSESQKNKESIQFVAYAIVVHFTAHNELVDSLSNCASAFSYVAITLSHHVSNALSSA